MRTIIAVAIAGTALLLGTAGTMAQTPYSNPYYGNPYSGTPSQSAPVGVDSNPAEDVPNQSVVISPQRETTGSGSNCHMVTRHMVRANGDRITVHRRICD
jgi:hypothetical protein